MNYLIIGYGNTLRSDDGVGYQIAEIVADWNLPGVKSISCHQLTPELAADMAEAKVVIFVDATIESLSAITVNPLEPEDIQGNLNHHTNPRSLLSLTQAIYGYVPTAYSIAIPGVNFAFGEQLSPSTVAAMKEALEKIKSLCL